ncbi:MAG: PIN domain-containing protein [Micromonosporaceae bacterium]
MFRAVTDTCVLFKPLLCDAVLSIAEEGLFQPLWSGHILDELRRNLLRYGIEEAKVNHRIDQMTRHFPGSTITDYEPLIPSMTNQAKDRHVVAAAVKGGADLIVTENLRDFPAATTKPYDIEVVDQDAFLLAQLDLAPTVVHRALARQASRYRRAPRTVADLLAALGRPGNGCPTFARECARWLLAADDDHGGVDG